MTVTINEAKAVSAKLTAIHRAKFLAEEREAYNDFLAENRACGYETVSFEEYIGERDLKAEFAEMYAAMSAQELQEY